MTAAARTRSDRRGPQESVTGEATNESYPDHDFSVVIRSADRRALWGNFRDKPAADSVAQKLRRHGFDALVIDRREVRP